MMEVQLVDEGDFVVEKGDLSYKLLVMLDGRAQVENDAVPIAALGPGDYVGETGIIRAAYRNAECGRSPRSGSGCWSDGK